MKYINICTLAIAIFSTMSAHAKNKPESIPVFGKKSTQAKNQPESQLPVTIAKTVQHSVSFSHTRALQLQNEQGHTVKKTITSPNAQFIKVHFSAFNIPQGAYVTVTNTTNSEQYVYDGLSHKHHTFNPEMGENGLTQFSAMSVFGDTAIVTLHIPEGTIWQPHHQLEIDRFNAGFSNSVEYRQQNEISPSSTCGVNERVDAVCWASSNPEEFERTRPVARLLMSGAGLCTGWRVGPENHMFTNNHCFSTQSTLEDTEIWFNYQTTTCGGDSFENVVKVTGRELLKTNYELDYTVFSVNNFAAVTQFGYFGLDVREPQLGEQIFIPQHGAGNPKELSIESDRNASGLCEIDDAIANGRGVNTDTGYFCDTIGGSSGSPVVASNSNNVIALHHFGGCENQGVRIDKIWPQVADIFNNQVPIGDNATGGDNVAPVADFVATCNGLDCLFSAQDSTDADGSITDYTWDLGDGVTASGLTYQHSYSQSGTYAVTLTVTDDDNAEGRLQKEVAVDDSDANQLTSGQPISNLSGKSNDELVYFIDTEQNNTEVTVTTNGGSGDADLYVKVGEVPTKSNYDCRPYLTGNNESCDVTLGTPGTVFIKLIGYSNFDNVTLLATNTEIPTNPFPKTDLNAQQNQWLYFDYTVPANQSLVDVSISGGTGDADLFVKKGVTPSDSNYDCRPYFSGNNESCSINVNEGDVLFIGIKAYNSFNGVTLDVK